MSHTKEDFKKAQFWLWSMASVMAQKVAPVYRVLNWHWIDEIPDEDLIMTDIREKAKMLSYDCLSLGHPNGVSENCGGIVVGIAYQTEVKPYCLRPYIKCEIEMTELIAEGD